MRRNVRYPSVCGLVTALAAFLSAGLTDPWGPSNIAAAEPGAASTGSGDASLPDDAAMEKLARQDPAAFLENCLKRYRREVKGYSLVMQEREREDGELRPTEVIRAYYREEPRSVFLAWLEGAGRADRVLYVEGENGGRFLAHPRGRLARRVAGDVVERDLDSPSGQRLSRFGLKRELERTLTIYRQAREKAPVTVTYLGQQKLKEAGDRLCYVLRFRSDQPLHRGGNEMTVYVDRETWLEVGLVIKEEGGKVMAEYFFRDIKINPAFKPDQFKRSALIP